MSTALDLLAADRRRSLVVRASPAPISRRQLAVAAHLSSPSIASFTPMLWGGRRMTPDQVRWIIEGAVAGNIAQQWQLFDLMEDTWPRLAKNLGEVRRAAARCTYTVKPYIAPGQKKPTDTAHERADLAKAALTNWRPVPGSLELSFEDALFDALDCYGKGLSVLEVNWQLHPAGILPRCAWHLPPQKYGWNADGNRLGLVADGAWREFAEGQFWVGAWRGRSGVPGQTALLRCLAPYWCGITFGWEWLLNYAQIFGVPIRWGTYDNAQPHLKPTLEAMLANMGSAGWAAMPSGTSLELKESVKSGPDNPQVLIQTLADKACDILILGQEASSESKPSGLGNGASELHSAVRADVLQSAAQWCADLLNYQLMPALMQWNFGDDQELPIVVPDFAAEPDPQAKALRDQILLTSGVAMPKAWFHERHSIPLPEPGEEVITSGPAQGPGLGLNAPGGWGALPEPPPAALSALRARAASAHTLPGAYQMPATTLRALTAAQAGTLAPLRTAAAPLIAALEAGQLDVIGELEAFIRRLDELAPSVVGASALADALEKALAEAAIAGAVQTYGKLTEKTVSSSSPTA